MSCCLICIGHHRVVGVRDNRPVQFQGYAFFVKWNRRDVESKYGEVRKFRVCQRGWKAANFGLDVDEDRSSPIIIYLDSEMPDGVVLPAVAIPVQQSILDCRSGLD